MSSSSPSLAELRSVSQTTTRRVGPRLETSAFALTVRRLACAARTSRKSDTCSLGKFVQFLRQVFVGERLEVVEEWLDQQRRDHDEGCASCCCRGRPPAGQRVRERNQPGPSTGNEDDADQDRLDSIAEPAAQ